MKGSEVVAQAIEKESGVVFGLLEESILPWTASRWFPADPGCACR
jgi:uncharacterized protein (UPF0210 family)